MQLAHRAVIRSQASRSFHGSSCCAKQELFEEWQRPLNKTQLKTIHKAQTRNNPRYNARFQNDAVVLLRKAYSRTTEEHHFDRATLQQLRNIIQGRAGDRFDVVDISTSTYALPLRRQPAEFLIVDSQCPNGRIHDALDKYSIMYDANAFTTLLEEHGFKCFRQHVSKKWSDKSVLVTSEHRKEHESKEGYEAPVTLHVSSSIERPMGMDGHPNPPTPSIIPSISFSLTLPHPAVLPLNRLLRTYFSLAPEIPQAWALTLLWVRSLGLGTSMPGMRSVDGTLDVVQFSERRGIASQSSPYIEELSPTCLALLFLVHLIEVGRLPNLFDAEEKRAVSQENESQHIWVPYTYNSLAHHPTHSQMQAAQQTSQYRQSYDAENTSVTRRMAVYPRGKWEQTSTQIDTAFARHATNLKFRVKVPKLLNSFFGYLSACAESRYHCYSLRQGARVPRDTSSRPQFCATEQMESAKQFPQRQHKFWKSDRLVVLDPFISTHNHAASVSSVTLHRITQCAKMVQKWVVRGHPLWATFGQHFRSSSTPSAFQQPRSVADARTEDNRQIPKKSHAAETGGSSASAANPTRASPPHLCDGISNPGPLGGLIGIQRQTEERACVESENLRLLENKRMQAKFNKGEQVAGSSNGSPRPRPVRRLGVSQFSRGVHTSAAPSLPYDKTVEETTRKPQHANYPRIEVDLPPIDNKYNISWNHDKTNARDQLIHKVRRVIQDRYGPRYDVRPYGSSVYMIGHGPSITYGADLDLVVLDSKWPQGFTPEMDMKHLPLIYDTRKLAREMRYAGFTDIEAIPWARVPIVKFTDPASGLNVDINVNERLGLLNTILIKRYCDVVPGLRCLVAAIKEWARPRALNKPSASKGLRTFNSYALVLMTVAWLQTRGLAPKLQVGLQPMELSEHLFWMRPMNPSKRIPCDTRYHNSTTWVAPPVGTGLDNLIDQWFRFWAGFQFSCHVIDIKRGGIYPRIPHFEGAADYDNVPRGPRSETLSNWSTLLGPDVDSTTMLEKYPISVVDPFIRSKNITKGINAQALTLFQAECDNAAELIKLGVNMTDIIDRFDLIQEDFNRYQKAGLQDVNPPAGSHATAKAESLLREINDPKLADVLKFNATHHRKPLGFDDPPQTNNHSKGDTLSVGRVALSDTLESSRIADGTITSPPRDAPLEAEQVRDDGEEGFGLKRSYFKNNRRV